MAPSPTESLEQIAAVSRRDWLLILARDGRHGMVEPPDKIGGLMDATAALEAAGLAHALIGGVAVGIHSGVPRATIDANIAVDSPIDRSRVVFAMKEAGFELKGEFAHSANFRHASGEPVQLAFDVTFDAMIERAERIRIGEHEIHIVTKNDLIESKRRAAADPTRRRSKALRDRADVELLLGDVPDPDEGW